MASTKKMNARIQLPFLRAGMVSALLIAGMISMMGTRLAAGEGGEFDERGNIVIADQFNNRVVEVDPATHKVVWQFGNGSDQPGPNSVVGTNDAERVGE